MDTFLVKEMKKVLLRPEKSVTGYFPSRKGETRSEMEVLQMQEEMRADGYDEELHDVLIAISVVAKNLARKIDRKEDATDGKNERAVADTR